MFNIFPQVYLQIYFHIILIIVFVSIVSLYSGKQFIEEQSRITLFFALFLLLFIGLRPINVPGVGVYFGDTVNYNWEFEFRANGGYQAERSDLFFDLFTDFCAKYLNARIYFFLLAALYVLPIYYACKNLNRVQPFILFLVIVASFLFWSAGVNGIRAGIGTSFLLLGYSYRGRWLIKLIIILLSIGFHKSMLLPAGAFLLSTLYPNTKVYLSVWFISIVLSQLFGGFWEGFFASINVGDDRLASYLTGQMDPRFTSRAGFRWDFLVYSALPVIVGSIYIFRNDYKNRIYINLFNTYLIANSFWILIIRANFSNRFAALSWFLLPVILILPLIDDDKWQERVGPISLFLFISFAFTYYMALESLWS